MDIKNGDRVFQNGSSGLSLTNDDVHFDILGPLEFC